MADPQRTMNDLDLVGGHVALDFANSGSLDAEPASERLRTYPDLVTFAVRTGLIERGCAEELLTEAERRPADTAAVLERALLLRAAFEGVFTSVAASQPPAEDDIGVLNAFLEEGMRYRLLEPDARCCGWSWSAGDEPLAQMLWPLVNEAADLLVEGDLERVKACGNETCGWLFVDLSRNRSRRWCDMKECGNRAKARRHYVRRRDSS